MTPFFSVVLPTKNRSHIVGDAIRCVFNQTFDDYELVVMDNSDDDSTLEVVKGFNDPRLHYHRSGGLPMADNWEAALRQANGEYLTIIEDKQLLYPRALDTIYHAVEKDRPLSANWYVDALNNTKASACVFSNLYGKRQPATEFIPSTMLITQFMARGHWGAPYLLPKGFNSVTHRSLYETILKSPAGRMCPPIAPDCTMGYLQVAFADGVLAINQALSVIAWAGSNGLSYTLKDKKGRAISFIKESGTENMYAKVPVKIHSLANNVVYNDLAVMRELVGSNLAAVPFDYVGYFTACFGEIVQRIKMGVDMTEETTAWESALREQPTDIQQAVGKEIMPLERDRRNYHRDVFMQKTGVKSVMGKIQQITGQSAAAFKAATSVPTFPSVLAAVEWEARGEYKGVLASQN